MIDPTTAAWFAAGLAAGLLHATLLRRAARRLTAWTPLWGMLRLGIVAAILVIAALAGEILAAAAGWAAGFVAVVALSAASRSRPAISPSVGSPSRETSEKRGSQS